MSSFKFSLIILILSAFHASCSITFSIEPCKETLKQNVLLTKTTQNEELPPSWMNIPCLICSEGSYITYNRTINNIECGKCPNNTYSPPSDIIRHSGKFYEFLFFFKDNPNISIQSNSCGWIKYHVLTLNKYLLPPLKINTSKFSCSPWRVNEDYSGIKTGEIIHDENTAKKLRSISLDSYRYVNRLTMVVNSYKKGAFKISFRVIKDLLKGNNVSVEGKSSIFRIYLNNIKVNEHIFSDIEWDSFVLLYMSVDWNPGNNYITWEYSNAIQSPFILEVLDIEVTGVNKDTTTCIPCNSGFSAVGSGHCSHCQFGYYYSTETKQCEPCVSNISECARSVLCEHSVYMKKLSPFCNTGTNKQRIEYVKTSTSCWDSQDNIDKLNKITEINCLECPVGTFTKKYNLTHSVCEQCENGKISNTKNQSMCNVCPDNTHAINMWYLSPHLNQKSFTFNIKVIESRNIEGEISINFNNYSDSEGTTVMEVYIDDSTTPFIIKSSNDVICVSKGEHSVKVDIWIPLISIDIYYITVKNTQTGGGYACIENNSFYVDSVKAKCEKENSYYDSREDKCVKCPRFTKINKNTNKCDINNYVGYVDKKYVFDLSLFSKMTHDYCKYHPQICHGGYVSALNTSGRVDKEERFFIKIQNDSTELNDLLLNMKVNGFAVKTIQKTDGESTRTAVSLGTEIDSIKFVNGYIEQGWIIKYKKGDLCIPNVHYSSTIFLKCSTNSHSLTIPKLINFNNKCDFFFEYQTRASCPICLSSQAMTVQSKCDDGWFRLFNFEEEDYCVINNSDINLGELDRLDKEEEGDFIINETTDNDLIQIYKWSNLIPEFNATIDDDWVFTAVEEDKCFDIMKWLHYWTIMFCAYLAIVGVLTCYIWFQRRKNNYIKIIEQPNQLASETVEGKTENENEINASSGHKLGLTIE